jgi:hypothetical protein
MDGERLRIAGKVFNFLEKKPSAGASAVVFPGSAKASGASNANAPIITIAAQPRSSISVSRTAAAKAGREFDAGFRMLMIER